MLYISFAAAFRGPISHITTNHNLPATSDLPVQLQTYRNEDNSNYKYCDINRFYSCETSGLVVWGALLGPQDTQIYKSSAIQARIWHTAATRGKVDQNNRTIMKWAVTLFPFPPTRNGLESEPAKNREEKGAKIVIDLWDSSQDEERSIPRLLWLFDGGSTIKNAFSCSNDDRALL